MRMDVSQHLRLEQQMKLAPRIIQAMEILQLPMLALQERIETEMQSNPVLEMTLDEPPELEQAEPAPRETESERGEQAMVVDPEKESGDFERLAEFSDEYGGDYFVDEPTRRAAPPSGERDRKMDAMANTPAHAQSLNEYLQEQWTFVEMDEPLRPLGVLIINNIDADGYLRTPLDELRNQVDPPAPIQDLQQALAVVQTLEPTGVGARNLRECLLLQLQAEGRAGADVTLETEVVLRHLKDVEANRLPHIARRTGRSVEEIKKAIENLSHLNPRPGGLIGGREVPIVLPDITITVSDDGSVHVDMPEGNLPRLHISRAYRKMSRNRATERGARQFLQRNIRSAQWLIDAILQRRDTVRRVAEEVFKVQRDFLDEGEQALRPLPMADVANKVGVHVATVSRAVAGKYVQTPRGIYPLRMFFSGGTTTAAGQDMSWDAVKVKLKELIDNEDKSNPLNDEKLAQELQKQGIDIARRTVAKYRELANIPPMRKRREY
ncbi:MAG TPA: RNA polymerase factor sigma-54 [Phycisphaerae bacterium]|nr:RNA polymerase factor sigma-54 [Phycisphaerae bacterium]